MKKLLSCLGALSLILLISACDPSTPTFELKTPATETIKVGFIGPLTGDVASMGQDEKAVVEMFFEENSMLGGKKVEVVFEDSQCNGQKAASAAEKLVTIDKVQLILGGLCSGETLGAAPVVERAKVLLFSSASTSPEVTTAGDYVFRNAPSDEKSSDVMVEAISKKYKKVAMISQNNDFAQAYRKKLLEKFPKAGVEVVVDEAFNSGTTDFKTMLQKVKSSKADVFVNLAGEGSPAGFIAKQATELGITLPVFGTDILAAQEFFDIGKNATEGAIVVIATADKSRADVTAFLAKFKARTGHNASAEVYVALTQDRMNILKAAVDAVGNDGTKLKGYLYGMAAYAGLGGETKFDSNGDSSILPSLMVAKGGKLELLK